jgi:hypothetical protein
VRKKMTLLEIKSRWRKLHCGMERSGRNNGALTAIGQERAHGRVAESSRSAAPKCRSGRETVVNLKDALKS